MRRVYMPMVILGLAFLGIGYASRPRRYGGPHHRRLRCHSLVCLPPLDKTVPDVGCSYHCQYSYVSFVMKSCTLHEPRHVRGIDYSALHHGKNDGF